MVDENNETYKTGKSLIDTDDLKKRFYKWKRQSGAKIQKEGHLVD